MISSRFQWQVMSIDSINRMIDNKQIDLCPSYQRDVVWSLDKKRLLINSALKQFPIPAVFIKTAQNEEKMEYFECVDGKQRLSTFHSFCNNEFGVIFAENENCTNIGKKLHEKVFFRELTNLAKNKIKNLQITVYKLIGDWPTVETFDFFNRIQSGLQLSTGELINAKDTHFVKNVNLFIQKRCIEKFFLPLKLRFTRRGDLLLIIQLMKLSHDKSFDKLSPAEIKRYAATRESEDFDKKIRKSIRVFFKTLVQIKKNKYPDYSKSFLEKWEILILLHYWDVEKAKNENVNLTPYMEKLVEFLKNSDKLAKIEEWSDISNNYSPCNLLKRYLLMRRNLEINLSSDEEDDDAPTNVEP